MLGQQVPGAPTVVAVTVAAVVVVGTALLACSQTAPEGEPGPLPTPASQSATATASATATVTEPAAQAPSSGSAAIAIAEATVAAPSGVAESPSPEPTDTGVAEPAAEPAPQPQVQASPAQVLVPEGPTLIQLIDPLDEPEFYCVDIPGFGNSLNTDAPLQAHTCKPGGADELFVVNQPAEGQLFMPAYDLCMEAEEGLTYTRSCSESAAQRFVVGADGTIRTGEGRLCLSVAPGEGQPTGGPSHLARGLLLADCAQAERSLSRWILPGEDPSASRLPSTRLMYDALDSAIVGDPWGIADLGDTGDPAYIPVLVELMRFPWWQTNPEMEEALFQALERIASQNADIEVQDGTDVDRWARWVVWIGQHPEVWPPPGFDGWKGHLFADVVDPEMGAFFYDGMPADIRLEEIVWGGVRKDGIPDLTDAPVINGAEAEYLLPDDRVFGVSINGEHRAYPHRIVNAHEMANDVLGGVPFALTY